MRIYYANITQSSSCMREQTSTKSSSVFAQVKKHTCLILSKPTQSQDSFVCSTMLWRECTCEKYLNQNNISICPAQKKYLFLILLKSTPYHLNSSCLRMQGITSKKQVAPKQHQHLSQSGNETIFSTIDILDVPPNRNKTNKEETYMKGKIRSIS